MISEFFLNIIFNLVHGLLNSLPEWSFTLDPEALEVFLSWVRVATFLFPMDTVIIIFALVIWFGFFRITIATVKTIWDILPLV